MKLTIISYSLRHPEDVERATNEFNELADTTLVLGTQVAVVGNMAYLHVFHQWAGDAHV